MDDQTCGQSPRLAFLSNNLRERFNTRWVGERKVVRRWR
jgi:hypothetical protein